MNELIAAGLLKRCLARTEITASNPLTECWWRVLKHQWLYLNTLNSVEAVARLVRFYVQEHHTGLPHSAFHGPTPDEMYFGTGDGIPQQLDAARRVARQARAQANRQRTCCACESSTVN